MCGGLSGVSADMPGRMLRLLSLLQGRRSGPARSSRSARGHRPARCAATSTAARAWLPGGRHHRRRGRLPACLRAGSAPLLLEDDEAVAIAVGLRTAAKRGGGRDRGRRGAGAGQVGAVLAAPAAPPGRFGRAGHRRSLPPGRAADRRRAAGHPRRRLPGPRAGGVRVPRAGRVGQLAPGGALPPGRHVRAVAPDRLRRAAGRLRTFRLDRVAAPVPVRHRFTPRELPDPDPAAYVARSITQAPYRYNRHRHRVGPGAGRAGPAARAGTGEGGGRSTSGAATVRLGADLLELVAQDVVALIVGALGEVTLDAPPVLLDQLRRSAGDCWKPPTARDSGKPPTRPTAVSHRPRPTAVSLRRRATPVSLRRRPTAVSLRRHRRPVTGSSAARPPARR